MMIGRTKKNSSSVNNSVECPKQNPCSDPMLTKHLAICRDQLDHNYRSMYYTLEKGLLEHKKTIKMNIGSNISIDDLTKIYSAISQDNPRTFYLGRNVAYTISDDTYVRPEYRFSKIESKNKYDIMIDKIEKLKRNLTDDVVENEFRINEYIQKTVRYVKLDDQSNQHMDSVLLDGYSVCSGIAQATSFILNYIGIPCGTIIGSLNGGGHAWNIVVINKKRYHLDVTNNILDDKGIDYRFFNMSDDQMKKTHSWSGDTHCHDNSRAFVGYR